MQDESRSISFCSNPQELWVDPFTGLPTLRHDLSIDRGMSFDAACARLAHERSGEGWVLPVSMATVRRTCVGLGMLQG